MNGHNEITGGNIVTVNGKQYNLQFMSVDGRGLQSWEDWRYGETDIQRVYMPAKIEAGHNEYQTIYFSMMIRWYPM